MSKKVIVAIDGPSGVGKTTVSRLLAARLGFKYVDTGAMYRSVAVAADAAGIDLNDEGSLGAFCASLNIDYDAATGGVRLNGADYSGLIRTPEASVLASVAAQKKCLRDVLTAFQRGLGVSESVVMEGRDIGTVVFPAADFKFFLDAPHGVRAARRAAELSDKTTGVGRAIEERDRRDTGRTVAPLVRAEDALYVDTGESTIDDVVEKLYVLVLGGA